MKIKRFDEVYLAIVVQNDDPQQRGRCKIFVPHISPHVYKKWNELKKDRQFKFIGRNINSDISDILEDLRQILPWAEQATSLVGENSSGRYNDLNKTATISDSNKLDTTVSNLSSVTILNSQITQYSQNLDNIGEKPGNKFDINYFRESDAFNNAAQNHTINVNKYSYNYKPETLSNCAKGIFSVPSVGAHVWCFFHDGDPMFPVYFAAAFGKEDWNGIYECSDTEPGLDYPGSYENNSLSGRNINTETYRNKFIINQKGGNIQITNSDNRETLKITHYSGSFKELNNYTNIEFASKNDQKLILGNKFLTVKGSDNIWIARERDLNIRGDSYRKIGNLNSNIVYQWKQITSQIADIKQLFEIRRAQAISDNLLKVTSSKQLRQGVFAPCPVCKGAQAKYWKLNNTFIETSPSISNSQVDGPYLAGSVNPVGQQQPPVFGSYGSNGIIFGDTCPSCGGTGISTSSMNGNWQKEFEKDNITKLISQKIVTLANLEQQMGLGGSEIIDITKHKIETIGLVMNDFGSIRIDTVGKMFNSELLVGTQGVYTNQTPSPLIEYVHVDDLPGGNYTLNVCNKFNVLVGAGGLFLKSYGPVNISGTITNIAGEQVNIGSSNEVNIDGGKRLTLTGDVVVIKQRNKAQVLIDSSLGVNKNVIIGGGLHVEGELTVNHITAPMEIQQTEENILFATTVPQRIIGWTHSNNDPNGSLQTPIFGGNADPDSIVAAAHSHNFRNLPLTLTSTNDEMRKQAKILNSQERMPAMPVDNCKK